MCPSPGCRMASMGAIGRSRSASFATHASYPNQNSGYHVIKDKVLSISKSGLLLGLVDGRYWYPDYALAEAASGNPELSDDSMEDVWACGLRLTQYAV